MENELAEEEKAKTELAEMMSEDWGIAETRRDIFLTIVEFLSSNPLSELPKAMFDELGLEEEDLAFYLYKACLMVATQATINRNERGESNG